MNNNLFIGRCFQYENNFFDNPKTYGLFDIYQVGELTCECGFQMQEHKQLCHEISYIMSGKGWFSSNGIETRVNVGDIYINSSNQMHGLRADENSKLRFAYLAFAFNHQSYLPELDVMKDFFKNIQNPLLKDKNYIRYLFINLIGEFYQQSYMSETLIENYIQQIIILTYRSSFTDVFKYHKKKNSEFALGETVYTMIKYIEDNINDIVTVNQIAKDLGYNNSYISHLFKNRTGMTILSFINQKKIDKAIALLEFGNMSISQIASHLNFPNTNSFNKVFKRVMGVSPTQYKKTSI